MKGFRSSWSIGILGLGIGGVVSYIIYRQRKQKATLPNSEKWQHVGLIHNLDIFPLRSGAPIHLNAVDCTKEALKYQGFNDRQFLLLLDSGKSVYAGSYPILLSITTEILNEHTVRFSSSGFGSIEVDLEALRKSGKFRKYPRKGFSFNLLEGKAEHHQWFSRIILKKQEGLRFYSKEEPLVRKDWWSLKKPEHFPVMLMTLKSVDDLNSRLSSGVQANYQQFRPNLMVSTFTTLKPFDEDNWLWVKIGSDTDSPVILKYNSLCYRCILPNIDVETFKRNPNFEPLKTLNQYRIVDKPKEPVMGTYFDVLQTGVVKIGDPVYVQYKNSS